MENIMRTKPQDCAKLILNATDECGVGGDFTLPEYCSDIAVVLKCVLTPYVQSRQWSSERLLVDGSACARILYLDEDRKCVHTVEFTLPYSCTFVADQLPEKCVAEIRPRVKYSNCRAISPRCVEIRGAVCVTARATDNQVVNILDNSAEGLFVKQCDAFIPNLTASAEKVITVNEALEFPENLPSAAMLLGGECRAIINESKLLCGKVIIKGQIYLHQLYVDRLEEGENHCLDFVIPFSQIMDVDGAEEKDACCATVQVLTDLERCTTGPDGESSILEVTAKLLLQVSTYHKYTVPVMLDAYHSKFPVRIGRNNVEFCTPLGVRWERTVLPIPMQLHTTGVGEIIDVWIAPQDVSVQCQNELVTLNGRMTACILLRDMDGTINYLEEVEEYQLEFPCEGNWVDATLDVTELKYRLIENNLELQVGLCVSIRDYLCQQLSVVSEVALDKESPYPTSKATALIYYAQPGESVWDIGCSCHASVERICEENDLAQHTIIKPTVLMVPIV